jgi:hypothetical protein
VHTGTVTPPLPRPPIYGHLTLRYALACAIITLRSSCLGAHDGFEMEVKRHMPGKKDCTDTRRQVSEISCGAPKSMSTVGDIWKSRENIEVHVTTKRKSPASKLRREF